MNLNLIIVVFIIAATDIVIPIQLQQGEEIKENLIDNSELNRCLNERSSEIGVCFSKELLGRLNDYDEKESFSLANGVTFVRDDKTQRNLGSFLDKNPMDFRCDDHLKTIHTKLLLTLLESWYKIKIFSLKQKRESTFILDEEFLHLAFIPQIQSYVEHHRSIVEDASELISKRSLHWDLGTFYPGLVMRIAPTLANGVLEFVIDPRLKERSYHHRGESTSTGRLIARNILVPFLLGLKFHISTLLPLLLGLLLLASKKAFFLAKLSLIAITMFSGGAGFGNAGYYGGSINPSVTAYSSHESIGQHHGYHNPGGYYRDNRYTAEYGYTAEPFYKDKVVEESSVSPITPDELRDRLERLFVTKKEDEPRDETNIRRTFAWTPLNSG